jgi:hypothetical protein
MSRLIVRDELCRCEDRMLELRSGIVKVNVGNWFGICGGDCMI